MSQLDALEANLHLPAGLQGFVWHYEAGQGRLAPHRHVELEANIVLSGHATYLVGAQTVRLGRRDLLWLFPAQNHVLLEESSDFSMSIAVWKPASLPPLCISAASQMLLCDDPGEVLHRKLARGAGEWVESLSQRILSPIFKQNPDLFNAALAHLLLELWTAWGEGETAGAGNPVHAAVERAARVLRDSNPPPSVPALAREVGLSPSRLSRLFAAQTGQNLSDFRARQCLNRALQLCEEPELSLSEICWRAGFGSYAQFHRVFVAETGQNPAKYRVKATKDCR